MSRTRHRQHTKNAYQWNPPPLSGDAPDIFNHPQNVVSSSECTGLEVRPVLSQSECVDYTSIYPIHDQKPQGNIGKDNPNNDPAEIGFHRG